MILFTVSIALEMIILILDILVYIGTVIWDYCKNNVKKSSEKFFEGKWIKIPAKKNRVKKKNTINIVEGATETGGSQPRSK